MIAWFVPRGRKMTSTEYWRFLAFYWVYTVLWAAGVVLVSVLAVPTAYRVVGVILLVVGTPSGGQLTGYSEYCEWYEKNVR